MLHIKFDPENWGKKYWKQVSQCSERHRHGGKAMIRLPIEIQSSFTRIIDSHEMATIPICHACAG